MKKKKLYKDIKVGDSIYLGKVVEVQYAFPFDETIYISVKRKNRIVGFSSPVNQWCEYEEV